jgi:sarcosine oxidase, subunit gamma
LCLRVGDSEALLLGSMSWETAPVAEPFAFAECDGFYPVPRRETHAWLLLLGTSTPPLFSKLCAVDFRLHKFGQFQIAQTHIAGVSAVIIRRDIGQLPSFHLLSDTTTAPYLWLTLLAAGREYDARPIGLEAVQRVARAL